MWGTLYKASLIHKFLMCSFQDWNVREKIMHKALLQFGVNQYQLRHVL